MFFFDKDESHLLLGASIVISAILGVTAKNPD